MPTKPLHKTNKTGVARQNHFISKTPEFAISGFRGYIKGRREGSYMKTFNIPYGVGMRDQLVRWMLRETKALIGLTETGIVPGTLLPADFQNTAAYWLVKKIFPNSRQNIWDAAVHRLYELCSKNVTDIITPMSDVNQCETIGINNPLNQCPDYRASYLFPGLPDPPWNDGRKWCTHCWLCGLSLPNPEDNVYARAQGTGAQPPCKKINQTTGALEDSPCPSRECEHILPFLVGAVLLELVTNPAVQPAQGLIEYGWGHKPCNGFKNQGMFIKHTFAPNGQDWMDFNFEPDLNQIRNYVEVLFSVVYNHTTGQFSKIPYNEYYDSSASDNFNHTVFNPVGLLKTLNAGTPNAIGTVQRRVIQASYSYNTIREVMTRICQSLNGNGGAGLSNSGVTKARDYPILLCYSQILRYLSDKYIEDALMHCKGDYVPNTPPSDAVITKFWNYLDNCRPFSSIFNTPTINSDDVASAILSHKSSYLNSFIETFSHALSKINAIPTIPQSNNTLETLAKKIISTVHKKATAALHTGTQIFAGGANFGKKRNKFGGSSRRERAAALGRGGRSIKEAREIRKTSTTDMHKAAQALKRQRFRNSADVYVNETIITKSHNADDYYTTRGYSQLFIDKLREDINLLLANIETIYHGHTVYDIINKYKTDLFPNEQYPDLVVNDYSDVAYETYIFLGKSNHTISMNKDVKDGIKKVFYSALQQNPPPSHNLSTEHDIIKFIEGKQLWLYSYLLTRLLVEHLESIYIKLPEYGNDLDYIRLCIEDNIDLIRSPYVQESAFGKKQISNKLKLMSTSELKTKLKSVGIRVTKDIKGKRKELTRKELESKASFFKKLQLKAKTVGVKLMYINKNKIYVYKAKTRLENEINRHLERIKKMKKLNKSKANKNKFG